jgi:hypothetical protein
MTEIIVDPELGKAVSLRVLRELNPLRHGIVLGEVSGKL